MFVTFACLFNCPMLLNILKTVKGRAYIKLIVWNSLLLGLCLLRKDSNPGYLDNLGFEHTVVNQSPFYFHSVSWSAFSLSVVKLNTDLNLSALSQLDKIINYSMSWANLHLELLPIISGISSNAVYQISAPLFGKFFVPFYF